MAEPPAAAARRPPAGIIPGLTPTLTRLRGPMRLLAAVSPALATRIAVRLFITPPPRRMSDGEAQFLNRASSVRLATAHGRVQAYDFGGTGPVVLIVHGWYSYAARLQAMIEALRARGLRVVAFDAPAHGRSGGRRADLSSFRDALAAVDAACGPALAILAHSFGALTAASWLAETAAAQRLRAAVLVGVPRDVGYIFDAFTHALDLSAALTARLRARFFERYGAYPEDYSAAALARRIHIPVLLVHGIDDEVVPAAHTAEVAEQLRDGQVELVPGLSHSEPLRDPDTVALMAQFIDARIRS